MKPLAAALLALTLSLSPASAAHLNVEFQGGRANFQASLGGFGGGFHRGGDLFGAGLLGFYNAEVTQARFEDKFADLMADYDDGLATIDEYYSSDEYADTIDDADRLVDRYDWFVTSVERSIDRIDDFIVSANDSLTFLQDLLTDYQQRDDLSERRLERIEDWITGVQDGIQLKIDLLTEKQTTLTENLPTYLEFQTTLTTYVDDIIAAGDGEATGDDESSSATALRALAGDDSMAGCDPAPTVAMPAPEPTTAGLAALAATALAAKRRRRTLNPQFTH